MNGRGTRQIEWKQFFKKKHVRFVQNEWLKRNKLFKYVKLMHLWIRLDKMHNGSDRIWCIIIRGFDQRKCITNHSIYKRHNLYEILSLHCAWHRKQMHLKNRFMDISWAKKWRKIRFLPNGRGEDMKWEKKTKERKIDQPNVLFYIHLVHSSKYKQ